MSLVSRTALCSSLKEETGDGLAFPGHRTLWINIEGPSLPYAVTPSYFERMLFQRYDMLKGVFSGES